MINEKIKIPKIRYWADKMYFEMEKIVWQSVVNMFYKEKYKKELAWIPKDLLDTISDEKFADLLEEKWISDIPRVLNYDQTNWKKMFDELYKYAEDTLTPLWFWTATLYLEEFWLQHRDMHPGNVMIDKNKNVYIIDFWRVRINREKTNLL